MSAYRVRPSQRLQRLGGVLEERMSRTMLRLAAVLAGCGLTPLLAETPAEVTPAFDGMVIAFDA